VLEKILVQPGENVAIGEAIAVIGDGSGGGSSSGGSSDAPAAAADEKPAEGDQDRSTSEAADGDRAEPPAEESTGAEKTAETPADDAEAPASSGSRIKATPLVRSLARTHSIDLADVTGSGPGGRIVRADIEQLIASGGKPEAAEAKAPTAPEPQAAPAAASSAPVGTPQDDDERVPLSQIRKVTARRLTEAALVPVFQLTSVVDASRLTEVRRDINTRLADSGVKVSVNDLIVRAVAVALAMHPEANASFGGDVILQHKHVNVGVAVALDDGLVVPVVKDADKKSVSTIGAEVKDLATRARAGRLKLDEMSGGTISVSNLGMFGVDQFTAVINPPEAIIVAVGGTADEAVVVDGEVQIRPRTRLTITVDHRVLDGAGAAAFLKDLTDLLTEPLRILV
jgi:pyruvate dehydrogenase E2 component (dihydrolipoamide acetyltransferase)